MDTSPSAVCQEEAVGGLPDTPGGPDGVSYRFASLYLSLRALAILEPHPFGGPSRESRARSTCPPSTGSARRRLTLPRRPRRLLPSLGGPIRAPPQPADPRRACPTRGSCRRLGPDSH